MHDGNTPKIKQDTFDFIAGTLYMDVIPDYPSYIMYPAGKGTPYQAT